MPLNRPAVPLGPGPRGVQDARRWVVQTCLDMGRPELAECAELAVSELVTNALLHGTPPLTVRVRGTQEHPRVEVRDGSTEPPVLPSLDVATDHEDLLLTVGRGLDIVARSCDAWGADIEEDGKTVWFTPAREFSEDGGVRGVITGADRGPAPEVNGSDAVEVRVLAVPVELHRGFQRHVKELRREVRLLALAHEADYPVAKSLSELFGALERHLRGSLGTRRVEGAAAAGQRHVDVDVTVSRTSARSLARFLEALDLADEFCREERLLTLARTPEQRGFQAWFLGEYVRQSHGQQPRRWGTGAHEAVGSTRRSVVS